MIRKNISLYRTLKRALNGCLCRIVSETKIPRNNKINIKLLPSQLCVLHVLVCLDGPRPLQSVPPFAGRGLLHKRERSCVPLPHVLLQGPQSLHSEYPPCTVTPDSSQFYQTK